MSDYLTELKTAIRKTFGYEGEHIKTVPVTEAFQGSVAWEGEVEVFALTGYPEPRLCFAWAQNDEGQWKSTLVLNIPPVDTPAKAVKAAIASQLLSQ